MGFFNDMKTCTKCKIEKDFIEFSKDKSRKDGYQKKCKICSKKYKITSIGYHKNYNIINSNKKKVYNKQYYVKNKEVIKELNNKYRLENKEKTNEYYRDYNKNRKLVEPIYKLICNTRNLIRMSMKGNGYTKKSKTYEILGCTFEEFKQHLESKFTEGMTWENQGKWHMDHIYPVSLATDENHLIQLNHYTNFQPLWAEDNLKKGNKLNQ